jgi:hypothetical protein
MAFGFICKIISRIERDTADPIESATNPERSSLGKLPLKKTAKDVRFVDGRRFVNR